MSYKDLKVFRKRKTKCFRVAIDFHDGEEILRYDYYGDKIYSVNEKRPVYLYYSGRLKEIHCDAILEDDDTLLNVSHRNFLAFLHGFPMCSVSVNDEQIPVNGSPTLRGDVGSIEKWFKEEYNGCFDTTDV